jgi:hypothetical protein
MPRSRAYPRRSCTGRILTIVPTSPRSWPPCPFHLIGTIWRIESRLLVHI